MPLQFYAQVPYSWNATTLGLTADVALTEDVWTQVASVTVGDRVAYEFGRGYDSSPLNAAGRIYMDLLDTLAAAVAGRIKIDIHDANDNYVMTILDENIANLKGGSATDRRQQNPFPENDVMISETNKIVTKIRCDDAAKTLDVSACTVKIDGWRYSSRIA